jgi:hypothetical protein
MENPTTNRAPYPVETLTQSGLPQRDRGNPLHQFRVPGAEAPAVDDEMTTTLTLPVVILDTAPGELTPYEAIVQMRRYQPLADWDHPGKPENFNLDGMSGICRSPRAAAFSGQTVLRTMGAEAPRPIAGNLSLSLAVNALKWAFSFIRSSRTGNDADAGRPHSHRAPSAFPRLSFSRRRPAHAQ